MAGKRPFRRNNNVARPNQPLRNNTRDTVPLLSEADAVKVLEKHLDALTKLFTIPLPLVIGTMVALALQQTEIKIDPFSVPRQYAEVVARTLLLLINAQCCTHILTVLSTIKRTEKPSTLWPTLSLHPGLLNPFTDVIYVRNGHTQPTLFFRLTLFMGRLSLLIIGFVFGFAGGFRTQYAVGLVSHWFRLGSWIAWPFSKATYDAWGLRAQELGDLYKGPFTFLDVFDDVVTLLLCTMALGMGAAIVRITDLLAPDESRAAIPALLLPIGGLTGWILAIILSSELRIASATLVP